MDIKIKVLKLEDEKGRVCPALISSGRELLLVDTGFPGQFETLKSLIEEEGLSLSQITAIVLTHQDMDHIGNINELKAACPDAKVYAHKLEAPYISGERMPVKLAQMQMALETMGEEQKRFYEQFKQAFLKRQTATDVLLEDGDALAGIPGLEAIHTPGHTPGHICLFAQDAGILIAGDALNVENRELLGPNPAYSQDMKTAIASLEKLTALPIQKVICFHGGAYKGDVPKRLRTIIDAALQ